MINRTYFIIFSLVFLYGASNNSIKSLIKTAKMHEKRDDYNSAISIYENLLKKDPYHRQSLRNLKSIYINQEKYPDGIQFLEKRIKTFPNNFNNYSDLGEFYYLNNQNSYADSIWEKGIKKFKNQRPFYRIMLSLYGKYNLNDQISNLLNFGRVQFGKSFLAYEAGIYFQARSAYDKSLDQFLLYLINEPEQNAIIERRVLLMSDDETAIPIIEGKLIETSNKNSGLTLNLLSEFYFKQQNYIKAFESKIAWSKLGNNDLNKWFNFADQLRKENQYQFSIEAYNYILEHKLHSNLMGKALFGLAKTFESQISPIKSKDLIPYFFDENIFFKNPLEFHSDISTKNLKSSLRFYDSLLVTLPNSPLLSEVYFRLGEIQYKILQDFDQAQTFFNKAIQNKPNKKLKLKIIERIADTMLAKGISNETIAFIERKLINDKMQRLEKKRVLIYLLTEDPDTTIEIIDELFLTIQPANAFFNDLMELKNLLTIYYSDDLQNNEAFKHFIKSEWYLRQQKVPNAISQLNFITNHFPFSNIIPLVNLRLSLLYYRLKNYKMAIKTIKKLEETAFEDRGIILLGQIYEFHLDDLKKAKQQYLQIIEQHENSIFSEPIRYHIRNINKNNS
ncbi:MAG: tetratricopeptide repeat protein [Candidatus Neomarinimicrobiota bacterium]